MPTINDLPRMTSSTDVTKILIPVQETVGTSRLTKGAFLSDLVTAFGYGYIGSKGDTGDQGDTGYTGSASTIIGYTGSLGSGFVGSRGSTGFVGSSGAQGLQGFVGSQGTGYTGSRGTGYTGSVGNVSVMRGATWVASSGAITTPAPDVPIVIANTCTLQEVTILTQGGTGSCSLDIWKTTYASYPPTIANSICGGTTPQITSGTTYQNNTLTGWTTAFNQNDTVIFHLTSSANFSQIVVQIRLQ